MTSDLLDTSAATWSDHGRDAPAIDPRLRPPVDAPPAERLAAWRMRHHLRREEADRVYESRHPERGWPVAGDRAVLRFARTLVAERRRAFVALVVLNGLAAATGLVVPKLLGNLVDLTVDADGAGLNRVALLVVGVVILQALFTFFAQRTSTIFGQDLLASAREYIVRTILRLPLGQVESASTGDLVTRVTRDVGTMSRSVQYGVPMAIISLLTVALSVVAMLLNSVLLAVPSLLVISTSYFAIRNYLRAAPRGYITEGATYSRINTTLTETVEGRAPSRPSDCPVAGWPGRRRHRSLRPGRALHDVAAQPAVHRHRRRLQHASRHHARGGCLGLRVRLPLARPDHRPCSTSRLSAGRSTGWSASWTGCRSARRRPRGCSASRRCRRTGRPATYARTGDGWSVGTCASPTAGPRRPPRHRPRPEHRRETGDRRSLRLRQVHARPAAVRDQPAAHRLGRRRRGGTGRPLEVLRTEGAGHPGAPRLHRHGAGQRRARTRGLLRRGGVGCLAAVGSRDWVERLPRGLDTGSAPANSR